MSDILRCEIDPTHERFVILSTFFSKDNRPLYVRELKFYCDECVKNLIDINKLKPVGGYKHV